MKFNAKTIESILGYTFDNKQLLKQAFTRSSYSEENGGLNNEVLEFLGDSALNLVVTKFLIQFNGRNTKDGFESFKNEGELTKLKSHIVDTTYLSQRADETGLSQYLIVGKSDKKITQSMKEDLMEAIFGAVCLDSNFNIGDVAMVVAKVLELSDILRNKKVDTANVVADLQMLLDEYEFDHPNYSYEQINFDGKHGWNCYVSIPKLNINSNAFADTKKESRQKACFKIFKKVKKMLESLDDDNDIIHLIGRPNMENCLQQINQLVQNNIISKPKYDYKVDYDDDGNPYWQCECRVKEITKYYFLNDEWLPSKKSAQKVAALAMLKYICFGEDE